MTMWPPDLSNLSTTGGLTLLVGWRRGAAFEGGRVKLSREVADSLRNVCQANVDALLGREAKAYSADTALDPEEYLLVPTAGLDSAHPVLDLVGKATQLDALDAAQLPTRPMVFYAIVIGDDPTTRTAFVRKTNPMQGARRGRFLTVLSDALVRLETPVFAFDDRVDLVIVAGGVIVVNLSAFELLFRGEEVLVARLPEFVAKIAARLPLADEAVKELEARAVSDSRLRRRLLSLHERGHLATVTVADIRREAKKQGLDTKKLINGGKLVIDEIDAGTLLKLLNEDLFTGGLSGARFAAERKAPR